MGASYALAGLTSAWLVVIGAAAPTGAEESEATLPSARRVVEEIVVTANRRTQNIQDTVGGISVMDGEALEKSGASGFEDYVFKIPGADLASDGITKKLAVRGVSNMNANFFGFGGTASPVGLYLNDTPVQGSGVMPDLDLYDLERIEVLKGPQGTLYGEGAQGGAFKMLLNKADPSALEIKGEAGVGQTRHGSGINHSQKLALNVPITGSWATRLVATRRVDQGYIDYFNRGRRGEDDATNLAGRLHLDGDILDGLSASALLLHQRQRVEQFPLAELAEGDLRNSRTEPQFHDTDFTLAGLTLDYDLDFATVTSATGLFWNKRALLNRFTIYGLIARQGGALAELLVDEAVEEEWAELTNKQFGISQEIRMVSAGGSRLEWVVGGFYRNRRSTLDSLLDNSAGEAPPPAGRGLLELDATESFEQFAGFGEATIELPWNLELGLGIRGFREAVVLDGTQTFRGVFYPLAAGSDGELPPVRFETTTTDVTPKASLSWFADEWRMLYAQVAQGTRSGGTNTDSIQSEVPPLFGPDVLWAYEAGAKTQWLDGLLTVNLAVFYNDWRDLQIQTYDADAPLRGSVIPLGATFLSNVGKAFMRGAELEISALPIENLVLGFNLFLGEGKILDGSTDGTTVPDNTPLPQLARMSYSAFASYTASRLAVFGLTPSMQFDTQSTGRRFANPPLQGEQFPLDAFQTFNLQLRFASETWDVSFGVRNLTDVRPQIGANFLEPSILTIGRPRTLAMRVAWLF